MILNPVLLEDVIDLPLVTRIQGIDLTKEERISLRHEANQIKQTRLWSILTNTLVHQAHQKMFEKAESFDDMVAGKTMLYNIDIQKKIVEILSNLKID